MSSAYNEADLELLGEWTPEIPDFRWQDKFAESENQRLLALVAWSILPIYDFGFKIVVIDKEKRSVRISPRRDGYCNSIKCGGNGFMLDISYNFISEGEALGWPSAS